MITILKRGGALLFSILLAAAAAGCSAVREPEKKAEAQKEAETQAAAGDGSVTLSLAEMHVAEHPITKSLMYFAGEVEKRTDGRVKVDVCPAELLGNENASIAKVCNGSIDMARVSCITMSEFCPELTPFSLPYIFESREHMWKAAESEMGEEMLKKVDSCQAIAWLENGARCFYSNKPIYSAEDMQGKRIRVPSSKTMYAMLNYYGATPVNISLSEVYSSIDTGLVDGAENDIISYSYFANSVVAKYFVKDNHSYSPAVLIASNDLKEKIGESDYAILLQCAKDMQTQSKTIWDEAEDEVLADLKLNGVVIIEPTKEAMKSFRSAAEVIYAGYPDFADEIEKIKDME